VDISRNRCATAIKLRMSESLHIALAESLDRQAIICLDQAMIERRLHNE